ncbi:MAG: 5'-nucleotidase C-terminal domain-containing protein [Bacillota bacterium]|jgi:2',3'-cyclic-nucleotide 2'-phosphodiesterase/3'-nucleotidase/5'-nucleotidase
MFISKKFPRLLTAITLLTFIFVLAMPGVSASAAGDKVFDIIEITDFHGTLEDTEGNPVAAVLAKNINEIKQANPDRTLILSGGDNYQGSAVSNLLKGVPVMHVFNSIGVAASALGNHEFDWGLDTVIKTDTPKYPVICANLFYKGTNQLVFDPYRIFDLNGVKIAVVGAVIEELPNIVLPDYVKSYEVGSIVEGVKDSAQDARAKGAQIVIALIHSGDDYNGKTGPVFDLANQLGGLGGVIDAVLGGHTHNQLVVVAANGTPVVIAGSSGQGFIDLKITRHGDGTLSFNPLYIPCNTSNVNFPYGYQASSPIVDQEVADIVNAAKMQVASIANQKLGTVDIDLTIGWKSNPRDESPAGNWVTDVMKTKTNADFAFINSGALRVDIPRGDITMGALYALLPFDNYITTAYLTGAQIKDLLEQGVSEGSKGIQVAGLKFTYDPVAPSGSRIVGIWKTDGTPIDLADTGKKYKVAVNDYISAGGDGFAVYKTVASTDTHILLRDALAEHIREVGHIRAPMPGRIIKYNSADLERQVTRAEFAGILVQALGLTEDASAAKFSDVSPEQKYAGVVGVAAKAGLVIGYEDGTFRPGNPVSRVEMVAMAARAIKASGFTTEVSDVNAALAGFNDYHKISGWAKKDVAAAVEAGIIDGGKPGNFAPFDYVTWAEATMMMTRTFNYINSR